MPGRGRSARSVTGRGSSPGYGSESTIGIGHTRWATHGAVTVENAHPHRDGSGRIWIVLNGIIENYLELRRQLERDLVRFSSDTDAEVLAHLIGLYYEGDLVQAVRRARAELAGHYAFAAMSAEEPGTLVALRHECPLAIGLGAGEQFVASSTAAFLPYTHEVAFLRDGELAELHADEVKLIDAHESVHVPIPIEVDWGEDSMEKEGFETFMLKEIYEQPAAIGETLSSYRSEMQVEHPRLAGERLRAVRQIRIVACGTSFHAGLAGRLAIERWARIPVEVDVASEFRYQDPIIDRGTLVLGITQSGETADTLAAMRLARERGATVVADHQRRRQSSHSRSGCRPVHASGARAGRRRHEDVRGSGGAALRVRPAAGGHGGEPLRRATGRAALRARAAARTLGQDAGDGSTTMRATSPSAWPGARSSCTWVAWPACRWRSRAPSSSRRSHTSRPTHTRPGR